MSMSTLAQPADTSFLRRYAVHSTHRLCAAPPPVDAQSVLPCPCPTTNPFGTIPSPVYSVLVTRSSLPSSSQSPLLLSSPLLSSFVTASSAGLPRSSRYAGSAGPSGVAADGDGLVQLMSACSLPACEQKSNHATHLHSREEIGTREQGLRHAPEQLVR